MKIQIQISTITCPVLINRVAGNMNTSVASQNKRREENCTGRYSRGLKNKNGEHVVNIYMNQTSLKHK